MWLREKHANGVCRREKSTKALTVLFCRTPEMGNNQCDGAGWLNGATEERTIIVPLQGGEGQSNHGSKADDGSVCEVGYLDRSTVGLHEPSKSIPVSQQTGSDQDPVGHSRAGLRAWASREAGLGSSGVEEQRLQVWPASGNYGQKLWKTETHKHEQDRPDGGNTDELIYREGKRKNTEPYCTPANSSATALQLVITVPSEWEVVLCSMQVIAALCLYNSPWP